MPPQSSADWVLGESCKLPSVVWGRASAKIEFGKILIPGDMQFTEFSATIL